MILWYIAHFEGHFRLWPRSSIYNIIDSRCSNKLFKFVSHYLTRLCPLAVSLIDDRQCKDSIEWKSTGLAVYMSLRDFDTEHIVDFWEFKWSFWKKFLRILDVFLSISSNCSSSLAITENRKLPHIYESYRYLFYADIYFIQIFILYGKYTKYLKILNYFRIDNGLIKYLYKTCEKRYNSYSSLMRSRHFFVFCFIKLIEN